MSNVPPSRSSRANTQLVGQARRGPTGRLAAWVTGAAFACMVVSVLLFFATTAVSSQGTLDSRAMIATGKRGSALVGWASFFDMFGYLSLTPLFLYLRQRFRHEALIDLYTVAGLAYVLIGALGAAMLATAGPSLIRQYATANAAQRESLTSTLATINQIVSIGCWQILEGIPAGVWLVGIGVCLRRAGRSRLSLTLIALGALLLLLAAARIVGN